MLLHVNEKVLCLILQEFDVCIDSSYITLVYSAGGGGIVHRVDYKLDSGARKAVSLSAC